MSGYQSAALDALETLLQAAPLSMRRLENQATVAGQAIAAERDAGQGTENPRGYAYDLELKGGVSEALSDLQFNQLVRVDVMVVVPMDASMHRLDQVREVSDLGEQVRSRVLTSRTLDARAEGLHLVQRNTALNCWVLTVPFSLRYEEDANAD